MRLRGTSDSARSIDAHGHAVEQAETGPIDAAHIGESLSEDLHPGADSEHDRP